MLHIFIISMYLYMMLCKNKDAKINRKKTNNKTSVENNVKFFCRSINSYEIYEKKQQKKPTKEKKEKKQKLDLHKSGSSNFLADRI